MRITQDVRAYAAARGLAEAEAIETGMQEQAVRFVERGGSLYETAVKGRA